MITKINFTEGTFIASKDKFGYQEVLDDFDCCKKIRIMTYNISKEEDILIEKLLGLKEDVDIEIITNIPARFEFYYNSAKGQYMRNTARTNIKTYLTKLNPDNFSARMIPFFNFNNHCKIVGTENIVYIGSQNFSEESQKNYETGVIIKDKIFIENLYSTFFEHLKEESIPYFDESYDELRLFCISILTRINNHYNHIKNSMFIYHENIDEWIFIDNETKFSVNDFYELKYDLIELKHIKTLIENLDVDEYELEEVVQRLHDIFSSINSTNPIHLLSDQGPFYNYVKYNYDDVFWECFNEYSLEAYDEYLGEYQEKAMNDASNILTDLLEEAKEDVYLIFNSLERLITHLKEINVILEKYSHKAVNNKIDNT